MQNLKENILRTLDIERQEARLVLLLLLQSSFLGIFFGAFDTAANSLFLGVFPAKDLPLAFTISGLAGISMTALYSYLQQRIPFSRLAIYNISFIAITTFLMWYGFSLTNSKWHVFLVLVMMGPLNILAMIGFWGTAGRIFSLRQGKRLFGLIDTGQIVGVILASYAIPIILSFSIKTKDILLVSSISALAALIFQSIIVFGNTQLSKKVEQVKAKVSEYSFAQLFKNKFVRLMAIFVALSMVAAFFISFSFLAVLKMKYPDESGLAKFLGVFTGTVMIFTLIIKTFIYSRFLKTYGLRTSLIISPALLFILTIIAVATGTFTGYTAAASGFIFFFLLVALSRLFSVALKSSMEVPSFKVLYQTVSSDIRHHVQSRIDGTVNEISALASGVILLVLGLLSFFKIINFSHVLLIILIGWTYVAYKLYKAYKNNLDDSLTSIQKEKRNDDKNGSAGIASSLLKGDEDAPKVLFVMNMQEKLQPVAYETLVPYLLHHKLDEIKEYAILQINNRHIYDALDTFKNYDKDGLKENYKSVSERLSKELQAGFDNERFTTLTRSKIASDRELAARLLGNSGKQEYANHLKFLLRDFDSHVKIAAIKACARLQNQEMATILSEFLGTANYGRYAFDALISIGEKSLDGLEHLFSKSGNDSILLSRIVRIIGNIGGEKACSSLVHKLGYHDIEVARLSAKMLLKNQFTATEAQYYLVHQALLQNMQIIAWNIAARVSLREANAELYLQQAISDELKMCFDHLYTLLSLVFEAKSISHIRQNIEGEGSESVGFAIELLELMISDDIKPILFPIIDDSSDNEKIRLLQEYFPVDKMPLENILKDIINRDYNYIGLWAKACALNIILLQEKVEITNDIIAQLFNPDEMLSQLAACIIHKNSSESIMPYYKRLPDKLKAKHQKSIDSYKKDPINTSFNRVLDLKSAKNLASVPGKILYELTRCASQFQFNEDEEIDSLNEDLNVLVYILLEGELTITSKDGIYQKADAGTFFGGVFAPGYPKDFPVYTALSPIKVAALLQEDFDKIVFDYPDFAYTIMNDVLYE